MTEKKLPFFQKADHYVFRFKKKTPPFEGARLLIIPLILGFIFFLIISRLFQLTIVKGAYYRTLAENNRLKELVIEAPRGDILDRKGFTIAYSVKVNTAPDAAVKRIYNNPYAFAQVIGYRQKASTDDINEDLCPDERLKTNERVGKEGIEKIYECVLRGKKGKKLIEVNASGAYLKTISILEAKQGKTIQTALDVEMQRKIYELLTSADFGAFGKKAAAIAQKPQTGEIIALVSTPAFSIQDFENNNQEAIQSYLKDPDQPLFNRATKGVYPPGSIFKLFVATGAIEEKAIDAHTLIEDTGQITAGLHTFGNWYFLQYGKTEGALDVVSALKRSNDIFFYKTGEKLGEDHLKRWADIFGFGKKTGVSLSDEEGLIPTRFWKKETMRGEWFLGDTYNLSIGQGYLLATPLQINQAVAAFANNGYLCTPQLKKVREGVCKKLPITQKTLDIVGHGMQAACETGGTGWPFFKFKIKSQPLSNRGQKLKIETQEEIQVGCKTGTAQSHAISQLPHAWFTVFAPFEKPEIVLTVIVEESGEGSNIAGPIAKEILTTYFERKE